MSFSEGEGVAAALLHDWQLSSGGGFRAEMKLQRRLLWALSVLAGPQLRTNRSGLLAWPGSSVRE